MNPSSTDQTDSPRGADRGAAQRGRSSLTEAGRAKLREAIRRHKPWLKSTGPRTPEGKARSAANGPLHRRKRQKNPQVQAAQAEVSELLRMMAELREQIG